MDTVLRTVLLADLVESGLDQLTRLADRLAKEGLADEAEEAYVAAFEVLKETHSNDTRRRQQVANKLAELSKTRGDDDQAESWRAEAELAADEARGNQ